MLKKILIIFMILLNFVFGTYLVFAETKGVMVQVTEKVPGGNCEGFMRDGKGGKRAPGPTETPEFYECTIEKGFGSVMNVLKSMLKYFTVIASLAGVLFIVINGIAISMGGIEQSMKEAAKGRIVKTLMGLIILLLSGLILRIVAPWIFT